MAWVAQNGKLSEFTYPIWEIREKKSPPAQEGMIYIFETSVPYLATMNLLTCLDPSAPVTTMR
jgi:hypothetical protein